MPSERVAAIDKRVEEINLPGYPSGARGARVITNDFNEWRVQEGENYINIIPPVDPKAYFEKDLFVHYRVGGGDQFLCPKYNLGASCPICEDRDKKISEFKKRNPDSKLPPELKSLYPSRRALYMIVDTKDEKEIQKGIQIWIAPWEMVEKNGIFPLTSPGRGEVTRKDISYPEYRLDVKFMREGKDLETKYFGFSLVESNIKSEEFFEERPESWDALLVYADYETIAQSYFSNSKDSKTYTPGPVGNNNNERDIPDVDSQREIPQSRMRTSRVESSPVPTRDSDMEDPPQEEKKDMSREELMAHLRNKVRTGRPNA